MSNVSVFQVLQVPLAEKKVSNTFQLPVWRVKIVMGIWIKTYSQANPDLKVSVKLPLCTLTQIFIAV